MNEGDNEQVVIEITTKRPFTSSNRVQAMSWWTHEEFDQDAIESYDDASRMEEFTKNIRRKRK